MPRSFRYVFAVLSLVVLASGCAGIASPQPAGKNPPSASGSMKSAADKGAKQGAQTAQKGAKQSSQTSKKGASQASQTADKGAKQLGDTTTRGAKQAASSIGKGAKEASDTTSRSAGGVQHQAKGTAAHTKHHVGDLLAGVLGFGATHGTPKKPTPATTSTSPGKSAGNTAPGTGTAPLSRSTTRHITNTGSSTKGKGTSSGATSGKRLNDEVLAFYNPRETTGPKGQSTGLNSLSTEPQAVTSISPLWYGVTPTGSLVSHVDSKTESFARAHHIKLMPLVRNQNGNETFLLNTKARDAAVANITKLVKSKGYVGVNIDFELLKSPARVPLEEFMDTLSHNLRPYGKKVTVDVIPTESQIGKHGAYNEAALARYSDAIVLMTYDHHSQSSPPGPVAPHTWVVAAVKHALQSGVPANKIILGVNDYGYDWNLGTHKAITMPEKTALKLSGAHTFDRSVKEAHVTYRDSHGNTHEVWYGNSRSLADRINIARQYKLKGIAIWRVGFEAPSYWHHLAKLNHA